MTTKPGRKRPRGHRESAPFSVAQLHRFGIDPIRLLIMGDDLSLGWGSSTERASLPGRLADHLHLATTRGLDIDLLVGNEASLANAIDLLQGGRIWRYDAILLAFDARRSLRQGIALHWRFRLARLLSFLENESSRATQILVLDITLVEDRKRLARVRQACQDICDRFEQATFVSVSEAPGLEAGDENRVWAQVIIDNLLPLLGTGQTAESLAAKTAVDSAQTSAAERLAIEEEDARIAALHVAKILDTDAEDRFDVIVQRARELFGARAAEINFIDAERQWTKAAAGIPRGQLPRASSFCNVTVQYARGIVVGDTLLDDRVKTNPHVVGDPHIRFYAGFPIESEDGHRIGSLCVWDMDPRDTNQVDMAALRELALRAQMEVRRRVTDGRDVNP